MDRKIKHIQVTITDGTLYHLNQMAKANGYGKNIGRVIDKLVRDKMLSMRPPNLHGSNSCVMCGTPIPEGRMVCPSCENDL